MAKTSLTHNDLCTRACHWLLRSQRCRAIVSRRCMTTTEQPDALGWTINGQSILIEVKMSKSDFLRDRHKPFRTNSNKGIGNYRYYLCPPNILKHDDIPINWGLLYCHTKRFDEIKKARYHSTKNRTAEIRLLIHHIHFGPEPWHKAVMFTKTSIAMAKARGFYITEHQKPVPGETVSIIQASKKPAITVIYHDNGNWKRCSNNELLPYQPLAWKPLTTKG